MVLLICNAYFSLVLYSCSGNTSLDSGDLFNVFNVLCFCSSSLDSRDLL